MLSEEADRAENKGVVERCGLPKPQYGLADVSWRISSPSIRKQ